jgi:hypothetical protein
MKVIQQPIALIEYIYNTFANSVKRPQAKAWGYTSEARDVLRAEILTGWVGSLSPYSRTLPGCRILAKVLI